MFASLSNSVLDTPAPPAYDAQWQMTQWNQLPQCSNGAHASGSGVNHYDGRMWVCTPGGPGVAVSTQHPAYYNPPRPVYSAPQNIPQIPVQSASGNIFMNSATWATQKPHNPIRKKPKRVRTAYTTSQINQLEQQFSTNRFLTRTRRMELAEALQLDERKIKVWFQNRRMKEKRDRAELLTDSEALSDSAGMISDISPGSSSSPGDSLQQDEYVVSGAVFDERYQPQNPEIDGYALLQEIAMSPINSSVLQQDPAEISWNSGYVMQHSEYPEGNKLQENLGSKIQYPPVYYDREPIINEEVADLETAVFPDSTYGNYSWIRPIEEYL